MGLNQEGESPPQTFSFKVRKEGTYARACQQSIAQDGNVGL